MFGCGTATSNACQSSLRKALCSVTTLELTDNTVGSGPEVRQPKGVQSYDPVCCNQHACVCKQPKVVVAPAHGAEFVSEVSHRLQQKHKVLGVSTQYDPQRQQQQYPGSAWASMRPLGRQHPHRQQACGMDTTAMNLKLALRALACTSAHQTPAGLGDLAVALQVHAPGA
jgi:hypothetical protein